MGLNFSSCLEDLGNLFENALPLVRILAAYRADQAAVQVSLQQHRTNTVQCGLDGLDLADDVNTINIVIHHALNATQVSLSSFQASHYLRVFHRFSFAPPRVGGDSQIILT